MGSLWHRPPKDCSPGVIQKPEFSGKQQKDSVTRVIRSAPLNSRQRQRSLPRLPR